MSIASSCASLPPVQSDYAPKGKITKVNGLDVYWAIPDSFAEAKTKNAVIICYDIFGFHENVKQLCDILASQGFLVALPDYLQGNYWTTEKFKNEGHQLKEWLDENAPPEKCLQFTTPVVKQLREEHKVQNIGYAGLCWGAMIGVKHCKDPAFDACILIHPSMLTTEDFKNCQCPVAFLPSKNEPDLETQFVKDPVLTSKPFASKIVHRRFDLHHGFVGARGNFKDSANVEAVNEVISISVNFLNENLGVKY
ncbi:Alpha/Beta hydrolase protein [Gigaspora rosea]|uniref:Alpha/Beta hydrolase protein n=1 Tax=Gigaspora rosea TaxID=44941 RepID=A0A397UCF6_9GLOM|nr:Alpha/Beta hydrolase protein [Gigaspora rosea]